MKKLLGAGALISAVVSSAAVIGATPWGVNPRVLACPETTNPAQPLTLALASGHGNELALRRLADNAWFFLVVDSPPKGYPQLMSPESFAALHRLEIPTSLHWVEWTGGSKPVEVFRPGRYEVYVSRNLESERGGFKCSFSFQRGKH